MLKYVLICFDMFWFALTLNFTFDARLHRALDDAKPFVLDFHLSQGGIPPGLQAKRGGNTIHVEPIQPISNQYPTNTEKGISMNQFAQFQ